MTFQAFKTQQPLLEQKYSSSVLHGCLQAEVLLGVASMPPSTRPGTAKPSAFQKMFLGILGPCCWSIIHGKGKEVAFSQNCKWLRKMWSAEEQKPSCALGEAGSCLFAGMSSCLAKQKVKEKCPILPTVVNLLYLPSASVFCCDEWGVWGQNYTPVLGRVCLSPPAGGKYYLCVSSSPLSCLIW